MIGPEAAENLTVSSAPYTDVPVDNNFAAVINYCKTANFISGYGDGTFRPNGKLTDRLCLQQDAPRRSGLQERV